MNHGFWLAGLLVIFCVGATTLLGSCGSAVGKEKDEDRRRDTGEYYYDTDKVRALLRHT